MEKHTLADLKANKNKKISIKMKIEIGLTHFKRWVKFLEIKLGMLMD